MDARSSVPPFRRNVDALQGMPLSVRGWDCLSCGTKGIDRDINAGKNILAAGLAVMVCGSDIRPDRHSSKGQLSKTRKGRKQKPKS